MTLPAPRQHFQVEALEVYVFEAKLAAAEAAAAFVAEGVRQAIAERGEANVIVATGASQYEFLECLRRVPDIAWPRVTAFHLDEYLGIPADHPASFRRYLRERLFGHLPFGAVHLLEGDALDPLAEARRYGALLAERTLDVTCLGIGENGHLAFNDPPANFETQELVHIQTIDDITRRQQVNEGHFAALGDVPGQALSLSIPAILRARRLSCVVPDRRKAEAVRAALEGPISPHCPASILRQAPNCCLFLDRPAASLLSAPAVQS